MVQSTVEPEIVFTGSKAERDAAKLMWEALRGKGMFVADTSPIIVPKSELVEFLGKKSVKPADIDGALKENSAVFLVAKNDAGEDVVITTRVGRVPGAPEGPNIHDFSQRLMTPEPKPAAPATPKRERMRVEPSWATYQVPEYDDEEEDEDISDDIIIGASTETTPETVIPDMLPADIIAEIIKPSEMIPAYIQHMEQQQEEAEAEAETPEPAPEVAEVAAEAEVVAEPEVEEAVEEPEIELQEAIEAEPEVEAEPEEPARAIDELIVPQEVRRETRAQVTREAQLVSFGSQTMPDDQVHRLSRGDFRKIREYIDEQEQPLEDVVLVEDILGVRSNSPDFETALFSLNYRMLHERDFEFVGTNDQRFWATASLPTIGTTLRKPNDIGTDYRYLLDSDADVEPRSVTSVDHVVTFYEYVHGLLPFDDEIRGLFSSPMLEDQKSAVFTFEIPQTFTTYLVELRYAGANRGGFLLGLDDFYADCVVPGAVISISATENDGHFKVEYLSASEQNDRLLELDERRSPRYHFRPTTFECEVDPTWLINEDRFPSMGSEKPLSDKVRRNNGQLLDATFKRIGMDDGNGGLLASFEDLLVAVNIERPMSTSVLADALEQDSSVSGDESNGFTYAAN